MTTPSAEAMEKATALIDRLTDEAVYYETVWLQARTRIAAALDAFAAEARADQKEREPPEDLVARCAEVREWHKTGLLRDGAVRRLAETLPGHDHVKLRLAEDKTAMEAMEFILSIPSPPERSDDR